MADPFVGEVRIFPFNFAPRGWAACNGQLMAISQNTALFSLLGANYGGDGKSTFALPNLQGASPLHAGQGPGLTERWIGERGGSATVSLLATELPVHTHALTPFADEVANERAPEGQRAATTEGGLGLYRSATGSASVPMHPTAIGVSGGSAPHSNMMPYLTLNFCIALQGIFPSRP
ncbi:MAG: phage tail protein [Polyangiaceae bacterium]|nr:phage tail protein [Polyangiaceae bacterium]